MKPAGFSLAVVAGFSAFLTVATNAANAAATSPAPIVWPFQSPARTPDAVLPLKPDLTVAADGSGDFKTIQAAVASIPRDNRERRIIFVKDGLYNEKVRIDASFVTIHGQSRAGTHIEFLQGSAEYRTAPDGLGQGVVNINGDDVVLENLVVKNTHGVVGIHAFAIYGRGDRTVIQDCDVLSQGNDTLSLWRTGEGQFSEDAKEHSSPNGRYYHARLRVCGSVDFICPRGWCYMADSEIYQVNPGASASIWHDGSRDKDMKFTLRNVRLDGVNNFTFARWIHDAQFFLLDCTFASAMKDRAAYQAPIAQLPTDRAPTETEIARHKELVDTNVWGTRVYFFNSHRTGGDYAWHQDNLSSAPGSPKPEQITARWTFDGKWDPENRTGPVIRSVADNGGGQVTVVFSENVTVKGQPSVGLRGGGTAKYFSGSGTPTLVFAYPASMMGPRHALEKIDLQAGAIVATEAAATLRFASLKLP